MITIRKSVNRDLSNKIPGLLSEALSWMKSRYNDINFSNLEFIFSAGYSRSRYFRNETNPKYTIPTVCISTGWELWLYEKKSLGIKKTHLYVGSEVQMVCALIHELTHHVQYEKKERIGNELDTTKNELEYLKEYYPEYYLELTT